MTTEVEARYIVPDRVLFRQLLQLRTLGPFRVEAMGTVKIVDDYMDTRGKALLRQGWACRLRSQDGAWVLNLKGPGEVRNAVTSRPELEVTLHDRITDAAHWPRGPIRDRVIELTDGLPLRRLLRIKQTRHQFLLTDGPRSVAHLSLDVVRTSGRGVDYRAHMLECELVDDGEIDDLDRLETSFQSYLLIPEPKSKLQRALELIETGSSVEEVIARGTHPVPLETMVQRYGVDEDQASSLAAIAQQLFIGLAPWHELADTALPLLRTAALLHDIGDAPGLARRRRAKRHIVGRDILLRQPIEGIAEEEQRVLAATAYLARRSVTEERIAEILPPTMDADARRRGLVIASLVRMARALARGGDEGTTIQSIQDARGGPTIALSGPRAHKSVTRARKRSDLWELAFDIPLTWRVAANVPGALLVGGPMLYVDDSMAQAAAKVLSSHFEEMLRHEEGTLHGRDIEELHDMRVATRRLRSALSLFGPYIAGAIAECRGPDCILPDALERDVNDRLRFLGAVLGDVRDLDVALQNVKAFAATLPSEQARTLRPLRGALRLERRAPRRRLRNVLRSRAYARLQEDMRALLARLEASEEPDKLHTVGNVAPRLIHLSWERVLAYDTILKGAPVEVLHMLRIDCKRLRYALEFFESVLPADLVAMIDHVKGMQDHLGDMHDAAVAMEMLDAFIEVQSLSAEPDAGGLEGVRNYRAECQRVMVDKEDTFPKAWKRFRRKKNRRRFDALLS